MDFFSFTISFPALRSLTFSWRFFKRSLIFAFLSVHLEFTFSVFTSDVENSRLLTDWPFHHHSLNDSLTHCILLRALLTCLCRGICSNLSPVSHSLIAPALQWTLVPKLSCVCAHKYTEYINS